MHVLSEGILEHSLRLSVEERTKRLRFCRTFQDSSELSWHHQYELGRLHPVAHTAPAVPAPLNAVSHPALRAFHSRRTGNHP